VLSLLVARVRFEVGGPGPVHRLARSNRTKEKVLQNNVQVMKIGGEHQYTTPLHIFEFEDEERHLIPSPKVATYDKDPKMSVQAVADKVAEVLKKGDNEFVMCNFAPPDMVSSFNTQKYF